MARDFNKTLELIMQEDSRYKAGAYIFVRMALDFATKQIADKPIPKHVSTKDLLKAVVLFARETFGPMAAVLFDEWNLKNSQDVGNVVFNMIRVGALVQSENDRLEDFADVYDFKKEFVDYYKA